MMSYKALCDLAPITFLTSFLTTLALADSTPATLVSSQFLKQACWMASSLRAFVRSAPSAWIAFLWYPWPTTYPPEGFAQISYSQ